MTDEVARSLGGRTLSTIAKIHGNDSPSPFPKRLMAIYLGNYTGKRGLPGNIKVFRHRIRVDIYTGDLKCHLPPSIGTEGTWEPGNKWNPVLDLAYFGPLGP